MLIKITALQAKEIVDNWLRDNNMPLEYSPQTPKLIHDDSGQEFWQIHIRLESLIEKPYIAKFTLAVEVFIDADHPNPDDLLGKGEQIKTGYVNNLYDTFS